MSTIEKPYGAVSDKPVPMVCPECRGTESYYGILAFPGQDVPKCPNHKCGLEDPCGGCLNETGCEAGPVLVVP